eukprot:538355-Karenia_brevis.AAC.1
MGVVQEVHGSREHVDFVLKKHLKDHRWFHLALVELDGRENSRARGLLFSVANTLFKMVQHAELQ